MKTDNPIIRRVEALASAEKQALLDYFAAHAPAEPPPWFAPAMPTPRPTVPRGDGTVHNFEDETHVAECAVCRARDEAFEARHRWDKEQERQRYIQWPYAWAETQVGERAQRMGDAS